MRPQRSRDSHTDAYYRLHDKYKRVTREDGQNPGIVGPPILVPVPAGSTTVPVTLVRTRLRDQNTLESSRTTPKDYARKWFAVTVEAGCRVGSQISSREPGLTLGAACSLLHVALTGYLLRTNANPCLRAMKDGNVNICVLRPHKGNYKYF